MIKKLFNNKKICKIKKLNQQKKIFNKKRKLKNKRKWNKIEKKYLFIKSALIKNKLKLMSVKDFASFFYIIFKLSFIFKLLASY